MSNEQSQVLSCTQNHAASAQSSASSISYSSSAIVHSTRSVDNRSALPIHQAVPGRRTERRSSKASPRTATQDPPIGDAIRRKILQATNIVNDMLDASRTGDGMELSNLGFELSRCLDELWQFRNHRESNWGDLINLLQVALVKEEFEIYTEQRCSCLQEILQYHLKPNPVEDDDLRMTVRLLRRAEIDPWKGLSQVQE
jgi:hypothetical protein